MNTTTVTLTSEELSRVFQALCTETRRLDEMPTKVGQEVIDDAASLRDKFAHLVTLDIHNTLQQD